MSGPAFSRPGAVNLSGLAKSPPGQSPPGQSTPSPGAGSYVVAVNSEQSLATEVVNRSMSVVVLLSVWSPDIADSLTINDSLARLASEQAGRFVVATLDAKANPALTAALGIPGAPFVAAALRGQLAPLFDARITDAELRAVVQQVLQAAAANGVTGTAQPFAGASAGADGADGPEIAEAPARFPEAEQALLSGDYAGAAAAYEKALDEAPGDREAVEGLARSRLLVRAAQANAAAVRAAVLAAPDDIDAQLLAADVDLLEGRVDEAFDRLLDIVRTHSAERRDAARRRLVDLFAVVGDEDPRVGRARRALTAALF